MSAAEEWRVVPDFPRYEVSNLGQIRGPRGLLTPELTHDGYLRVGLSSKPRVRRKVHQVVLLAFVGPCPEGMQVRHLDGDPTNNSVTNLRYGTHAQNMQDRLAHGTNPMASRTHCIRGHKFDEQNTYIHPLLGSRRCRACERLRRSNRLSTATRQLAEVTA